jgi:TonB family protein
VDPQAASAPSAAARDDDPVRKQTIEMYGLSLRGQMRRYLGRANAIATQEKMTTAGEAFMVIEPDGRISELSMFKSSGNPAFDKAYLDAMRNAKPLVPVPSNLRGTQFALRIRVAIESQQ